MKRAAALIRHPSGNRQPSPLEPRTASHSACVLRLPPPAGASIQNEPSDRVGSGLLWKRRAEAAPDALDKAQRQLQACKRREQRLTKLQQGRRGRRGPRRLPAGLCRSMRRTLPCS
ncbi:hypothetical protein EI555_003659 [Monodon monoceros]|uniref:Uncharacterized protein n=1 Tax=Monodon monoceros TaxID=40151 RepID=A0A4U1FF59_MONMO|nr:hypothetical protein EI555_003659 [Monodon monoceros]